ncbi:MULTISPECIES: hypothetical protein [Clostridium]|jgi:hypothetical protein|uniref:hypothetical protein n=1 Tax=Clostridium TaxID=1485 RepID=UPI000C07A2D0|nr:MULTISPECIES: hypothetical protein [Clostridium]MDU4726697.1 hypothetical protein [Clostridium sp.]
MKRELKFNDDYDLDTACFLLNAGGTMEIDNTEVLVNGEKKICEEMYNLLIGKVAKFKEIGDVSALVTLTDGQVFLLSQL